MAVTVIRTPTIEQTKKLATFRNFIINGSMNVWQRGNGSWLIGSGDTAFAADRWNVFRGSGTHGGQVSQQSDPANLPTNFKFALRFQRYSGDSQTNSMNLVQDIESINSYPMRGKTVTLSFYARSGSGYSSTNNILKSNILYGFGTDNAVRNGLVGSVSNIQNNLLTSSWKKFTQTVTLSDSLTQVCLSFSYNPTGTANSEDWFEITGVQLELGSIATDFEFLPNEVELSLCYRYFWYPQGISIVGATYGSGLTRCPIILPVEMRATPTVSGVTTNNTKYVVPSGTSAGTLAAVSSVVSQQANSKSSIYFVVNTGQAAGSAINIQNTLIMVSAEI